MRRCRALMKQSASCHWDAHRKDFAMGVDGWWPDEGDPLDIASRLVRNRMYWEGPQIDRPNERPYALHRNGYAGMQRYASFLWSGDVYSTWETLKTHVPIALNTALSGIPYWGTDIGGFVPTPEFTAELYVRWFQFGAFCPLFRCHGRTWKLRLPWGWNTGDPGPVEINNYNGAAIPDSSQLHDARVEPICRKYLELRYRMLPYLYSAVHECATTGMPIMRASVAALSRRSEGGRVRRRVFVGQEHSGCSSGREGSNDSPGLSSALDLVRFLDGRTARRRARNQPACGPRNDPALCARGIDPAAGSGEAVYGRESRWSHFLFRFIPGADASFLLYEDDGTSFNYRNGEWMGIQMAWDDATQNTQSATRLLVRVCCRRSQGRSQYSWPKSREV